MKKVAKWPSDVFFQEYFFLTAVSRFFSIKLRGTVRIRRNTSVISVKSLYRVEIMRTSRYINICSKRATLSTGHPEPIRFGNPYF